VKAVDACKFGKSKGKRNRDLWNKQDNGPSLFIPFIPVKVTIAGKLKH
jgi:hypothetical protein